MKESNKIWSNIKKSLIFTVALGVFALIIYDWFALWEEQRVMTKEYTEE